MTLDEFLKEVDLSGVILRTRRCPSHKENYYVYRLKNTSLIQRYITIHEDLMKSKANSLSIERYDYSLQGAERFLEVVHLNN